MSINVSKRVSCEAATTGFHWISILCMGCICHDVYSSYDDKQSCRGQGSEIVFIACMKIAIHYYGKYRQVSPNWLCICTEGED